ncbi:MAG TPA: PAS domain-containing protein [Polyangiaceae bacterium]|nr:PAS domain-containing protein [Polyangiaceae bacterium]
MTTSHDSDGRRLEPPREERSRLERQLAAAQAITHLGSWEWDIQTNVVQWSDELYRIYGLEPHSVEITFESFLSRLHPDDRDRVQREVGLALAGGGGTFAYPERIIRPDGSVRYIETAGEVQRDDAGLVTGLLGTCRDVTDDRKREHALALHTDIVEKIQIGIAVWSVENGPDDARLVAWNPASERLARVDLRPMVGKALGDILPFAAGGKLEALIRDVAIDGQDREAVVEGSRDPSNPTRSVSFKAFALPDRCVGTAVEDITAQTLAKWMARAEQRIFELIAEGAPLSAVLEKLASAIEEQSPATLVSIMLMEPDGVRVRVGAAPRLPRSFCDALNGLPIGPTAGSCGTAAFLRKTVIVTDIESDELWKDYRELARAASLRACWSTPIFAIDGHVLGTFAMYYREPRSPVPEDFVRTARATHIASIAIERRQMEDELRALSGHLQKVREEERTGIARVIHDDLGQALTALKMELAWVTRRARAGEVSPESLAEKMTEAAGSVDSIIDRVRRISSELRPGILDDLGLVPALEWQGQEFQRRSGTTCLVTTRVPDGTVIGQAEATALFRIFQEALTNVARHGEASSVEVRLDVVRGEAVLEVEDDGKGIEPPAIASPESLGLVGIRERARALGGDARVSRGPSRGTIVSVKIPLSGVAR